MDAIFHEKQEGNLCAQHCLNALLQGPYYSAVDLAAIAAALDERERSTMAEAGLDTPEYRAFCQQPSSNFDDSGFFSIQVISEALQTWGLSLVPAKSPEANNCLSSPENEKAFICNYREHWFTIRKLGYQWFNLNSMQRRPKFISDTYLSLLLAQLVSDGYTINVVRGALPECSADALLLVQPYDPALDPEAEEFTPKKASAEDLAAIGGEKPKPARDSSPPAKTADADSVRAKRLAFFDKQQSASPSQKSETSNEINSAVPVNAAGGSITRQESSSSMQDEDLQEAIRLSLMSS